MASAPSGARRGGCYHYGVGRWIGGSIGITRMARVTVEDCLEQEENRFALVILASARTRQLMRGALPRVRSTNKPSVTSLREIAAGKVRFSRASAEVLDEWVAQQQRENDRRIGDRERQLRTAPDSTPRRAGGR